MVTPAMVLQIIDEAEARANDASLPADVRERSAETLRLCMERLASEGITRAELEEMVKAEA